ncbi:MAG TPA: DUF4157 domain-containing protein [Roseateles sp.]
MPGAAAPQAKPPAAAAAKPAPKPAAPPPKQEVRPPPKPAPGAKVQAKSALPTSRPGDAAEQEADRIATRVMRAAAPAGHAGATPAAGGSEGPQLSGDHIARLGPGEPLPPDLRAQFEPRFGASLEDVRVLADGAAAEAASSIQARAFTLGHRIGFAAGEYQPTTPDGQWLLAHEIAHVLQQQDGSVPRRVYCAFVAGATGPSFSGGTAPLYTTSTPLRLPPIKSRHLMAYSQRAAQHLLRRPAGYDRETASTTQATIWAGVQPDLSRLPQTPNYSPTATLDIQVQGGAKTLHIPAASAGALQEHLRRPRWNAAGDCDFAGEPKYDIDHKVEYQIGGVDELPNLELLDSAHNRSVGGQFRGAIDSALRADIAAAPAGDAQMAPYRTGREVSAAQLAAFKAAACVEFTRVEGQGERATRPDARREGSSTFLSAEEITRLDHVIGALPPTTPGGGSPTVFSLLSPTGALQLGRIPHTDGVVDPARLAQSLRGMSGFTATAMTLEPRPGYNDAAPERPRIGTLTGDLDLGPQVIVGGAAGAARRGAAGSGRRTQSVTLDIVRTGSYQGKLRDPAMPDWPAEFTPCSPLDITGLSIGRGVFAQAVLHPSHPALSGLNIPAQVIDGRLQLVYTMDATQLAQRLRIPGITINSASVSLGYDGDAFSVGGDAQFEIRNFGRGELRAVADDQRRFQLEGSLSADTQLFDQAEMRLWYRSEGGFGGEGTLAITNPNKIRGIRAARVTARYDAGVFSATGSVEPSIPGLQSAGLAVRYGPDADGAQSLLISGDLQLAPGIPGVRGGQAHVELLQRDGEWQVAASGELQPAIPGIDATLRARYERGAFTASVDTPFHVGERLSGNLLVGVSNVESDSQGRPVEGAVPGDSLLAFGQGSATLRLTDQFQGDFGIRVGTDAAVRISGSVGISQPIRLFDARTWSRELVHFPTISIPIFGVAVGGNVVGIAATIGGGINAEASIGPGQIDQGTIGVQDFDPAQPDSLHVTGRVHFNVPAQAGINGHLDAGISAGLAVIRATGGLSINLNLGVDASAGAGLDLDWTQTQGLALTATLQASATPRLRASVRGFAEVVADAFVTSFTLWRKDYTLAQREFGSGLTVGVNVPVTWTEQRGLDFDINRVQFQVPEITPDGALGGLLRDEGGTTERNETEGGARPR